MKKIIFSLLILLIPFASAEFSYFVELNYDLGELSYTNLEVISGESYPDLNPPEKGHIGKITDFHNKELFSFVFEFSRIIYDLPEISLLEESSKILTLPYYNEGRKLSIYDENGVLKLEINLSHLAMCNQNYLCEPLKENHETCPLDCIAGGKDQLCETEIDGVCDPDCSEDFECSNMITDHAVINELVEIYSKEIDAYKNINEAKHQVTQREERIQKLKLKNPEYWGWAFWMLVIFIVVFLVYRKAKFK